jgi:hypothetical protein
LEKSLRILEVFVKSLTKLTKTVRGCPFTFPPDFDIIKHYATEREEKL